ncbi:GntR family transcriptional regulator [Latilactobacillus curvatus]|uniref:GntR family transcriptional regulator n=1 Tax=Latilactobacillus curvatus TaxID=28038 RepID=UPI0020C8126C|nr:GntR family transcriptional regulator [Latilactobacillus curvatus]MCP8865922.1 GntR family transcriptional regulator [Latilactobacillus curvatus]MCP8870352.1 GntR family transcriptional regulator [Latilactobacillus curvatus]
MKQYLFETISDEIETRIQRSEFKSGMFMPSEAELQQLFGASRTTIRKALDNLVAKELIIKKNGVGVYVKPQISSQNILEMTGVMKNNNLGNAAKQIKEFHLRKADKYYGELFDISDNALLYTIKHVYQEKKNQVYETIILPQQLYPTLSLADIQMVNTIELVNSAKENFYGMQQDLQLVSMASTHAKYLDLEEDALLFKLSSQYYAENHKVIGISNRYEPADTTEFNIDFN